MPAKAGDCSHHPEPISGTSLRVPVFKYHLYASDSPASLANPRLLSLLPTQGVNPTLLGLRLCSWFHPPPNLLTALFPLPASSFRVQEPESLGAVTGVLSLWSPLPSANDLWLCLSSEHPVLQPPCWSTRQPCMDLPCWEYPWNFPLYLGKFPKYQAPPEATP